MRISSFDFDNLVNLIGCSENDLKVRKLFGHEMHQIKRDEHSAILEFKPEGVDVVFKEAPWVVPAERITDPAELYLVAFHLYREGYEGFANYSGQLPKDIKFGDSEMEILRKMGQPVKVGGGTMSRLLNRRVPRWYWYSIGNAVLHLQFDERGRLEMATPQIISV